MLTFREVARIIQGRYHLDAATANETAKAILSDCPKGPLHNRQGFLNENELLFHLDSLEGLGAQQ